MTSSLVRWDPLRELSALQSDVNSLFDLFFPSLTGNGAAPPARWIPAMDITETDDSLVVRLDLPGLRRDDIEIEVEERTLTIRGERRSASEETKEGYHRVERAFGSFSRSLDLPQGVDLDQISADFENGVLEIRVPFPEERKPRRIKIGGDGASGEDQPDPS